jgi:hypothetical protein
MQISAGQLSNVLIKDQEVFHAASAAVVKAGLESAPWQHLDSTGTRVNGSNQQCHVLCNPLYTAYGTTSCKDRLSLLRVLLGGADPTFRLHALALQLLPPLGVSPKWITLLTTVLVEERDVSEEQIDALLDGNLPGMGPTARKSIKDALAIAADRTQTGYPVVHL